MTVRFFPTALLVLAVIALLSSVLAAPVRAQPQPARADGANRYDTAATIAALDHPGGSDTVILARADDYADAMASATVSGRLDAPVLVTDTIRLNDETRFAIERLDPDDVVIFGGTAAITSQVETDIATTFDVDVRRIAGGNRFETAADAAAVIADSGGLGQYPAGTTVAFVTEADDFAGTLAAGAPAAAQGFPILLVESDRLPPATADAIVDLVIGRVYVIGNETQISDDVADQIASLGAEVQRIGGPDRLGTVTAVADVAVRAPWLTGENAVLARGDLFVDTLAAAPHAARLGAPVVLAEQPDVLGDAARTWLADPTTPALDAVQAIGGTAAITVGTLEEATLAASEAGGGQPPAVPSQEIRVTPMESLIRAVGSPADFSVTGRYDDRPLAATVDLALFPCANADIVGSGPDTFIDADADGHADGLGETDTGLAAFATLNEEDITDQRVLYEAIVRDGQVTTAVVSIDGPDCAVVMAWQDADDDGEVAVDGEGQPVESYGVGRVTFN
ncbi:cell wall-binding repeat-containing protein [Euzebya tangerina]|uniref:cell wall-binding repeat-containing protein n=1 Tax=Euzebya tangerina TaxID=591198 RepID=UPI0013C30674|nr:cell wall-binding repeat-containing protein [Euzebya tangerina]